jgi:hypothetical protein
VTLRLETKEDKMGIKMTGKNREKSWCGWFRYTPPLKIGNKVWISSKDLLTNRPSPKLKALRYSPFPVTKVTGPLTYQVKLPDGWRTHNIFHWSKLTPTTED